jgi:hypothetical protein
MNEANSVKKANLEVQAYNPAINTSDTFISINGKKSEDTNNFSGVEGQNIYSNELVNHITLGLSLGKVLTELRGRVREAQILGAEQMVGDDQESTGLNFSKGFKLAGAWRGLFLQALRLHTALLGEHEIDFTPYVDFEAHKPCYVHPTKDQLTIKELSTLGLSESNQLTQHNSILGITHCLRISLNLLICLYLGQKMGEGADSPSRFANLIKEIVELKDPCLQLDNGNKNSPEQALIKNLTNRVEILILAWDSYVREQLFATDEGLAPAHYAYEAGRAMASLGWNLTIQTAYCRTTDIKNNQSQYTLIKKLLNDYLARTFEKLQDSAHNKAAVDQYIQEEFIKTEAILLLRARAHGKAPKSVSRKKRKEFTQAKNDALHNIKARFARRGTRSTSLEDNKLLDVQVRLEHAKEEVRENLRALAQGETVHSLITEKETKKLKATLKAQAEQKQHDEFVEVVAKALREFLEPNCGSPEKVKTCKSVSQLFKLMKKAIRKGLEEKAAQKDKDPISSLLPDCSITEDSDFSNELAKLSPKQDSTDEFLDWKAARDGELEKIYLAWLKAFKPGDVAHLQYQLTALIKELDKEYQTQQKQNAEKNKDQSASIQPALPQPPTFNIAPAEQESPTISNSTLTQVDLESPQAAIIAVIQSLTYWQKTILEMSENGSLHPTQPLYIKLLSQKSIPWKDSLKPHPSWTYEQLMDLRYALIEQTNHWYNLIVGRQSLASFRAADIASDLIQQYGQKITGLAAQSLMSAFEEIQKEFSTLAKVATDTVTEITGGMRGVLSKSLWITIPVTIIALLVGLILLTAIGINLILPVVAAIGGGTFSLIGAGTWGFLKLKNAELEGKKKISDQEQLSNTQIVQKAGVVGLVSNAAKEFRQQLELMFKRGFEQIQRELALTNSTLSLTGTLIEYVARHCTAKCDIDFLSIVIWNEEVRKAQLNRVTLAAFGPVGVFLIAEADSDEELI